MARVVDRAQELADNLIGTSMSLHDRATQEEIDDHDLMSEFHLLAFECDGCGWWASTEELHNETDRGLCQECYDAENS